tara:strand:+ start:63 stop:332 length:270 start_codon:yes stop_codon:yes gene_type:complete
MVEVNKPNEWEQGVIDNAVEYSILEWRSLDRSTKTIVKTYEEAKSLFAKTIKEHTATLAYAIDKNGRYANLNHLPEFKSRSKYVKSKKR